MNEERKAVITVTESGTVDIDFSPLFPLKMNPTLCLR